MLFGLYECETLVEVQSRGLYIKHYRKAQMLHSEDLIDAVSRSLFKSASKYVLVVICIGSISRILPI